MSERKNTQNLRGGGGGGEHNHDVHGPDKQAGQEALEETGILRQAGRERQGPWSRQLAALAIPRRRHDCKSP